MEVGVTGCTHVGVAGCMHVGVVGCMHVALLLTQCPSHSFLYCRQGDQGSVYA